MSWPQVLYGGLTRRGPGAVVAAAVVLCLALGAGAALMSGRVFWLVVVVVSLAILTVRWPPVGVVVALLAIPLTAWIRRLTGGADAYVENDPLILLPTLAVCVSLLAARPTGALHTRGARLLLALAVSVSASGIIGMAGSLTAGAYGLATQLVPILLALLLAAGLWPSMWMIAVRTLLVTGPAVGAYGVAQRFSPTSYDLAWLLDRQRAIASIGDPEPGAFRIFGTMESPGPFAFFLALSLLCWLSWGLSHIADRRYGAALAGLFPVGVLALALSVTAVRTALIAVPISLLVWAGVSRGQNMVPRLVLVGALAAAALILPVIVGPTSGGGSSAAARFDPSSIASDVSFQERALLLGQFGSALSRPLGGGVGTTGNATSLATGTIATVDNGYLSRTLETGPIGLAVFLVVVLWAARVAKHAMTEGSSWEADARLLVIIAFLWLDVSGPASATAVGMYFWVAVGSALAIPATATEPARARWIRA